MAGIVAILAPLAVIAWRSAMPEPVAAAAPALAATAAASAPAAPDENAWLAGKTLPPGGRFHEGKLLHTLQKKQTLRKLAARYLDLTTYYTRKELEQAIRLTNGLTSGKRLSVGKEIEIPGVRKAAAPATRLLYDADFEARAIYVTAPIAGSDKVLDLVRTLKPLGINTVVFDVKDISGVLAFDSAAPLAVATHASARGPHLDLGKLVARLHAQGIYVIARQALFQDRWLARRRPELALRDTRDRPWREGTMLGWLDPANEAVRGYNLALAREVDASGVDEIQLDYVRFPAMGDIASIRYSFDTAKIPKHRIITTFVESVKRALAPSGVTLSLDIYGVAAWGEPRDVETIGQKVEDLARAADVLCPMLYPSHFYQGFRGYAFPALEPYHFVHEGISRIREKTAPAPARVRPWLQAFPYRTGNAFDAGYVVTQIEAARDAHGLGWMLWDTKNQYRVARQALERLGNAPP